MVADHYGAQSRVGNTHNNKRSRIDILVGSLIVFHDLWETVAAPASPSIAAASTIEPNFHCAVSS